MRPMVPGERHLRLLAQIVHEPEEKNSQVAPQLAAEASIVGLFQLLMVSSTFSSSSPRVVKPVTLRESMIDLLVLGSITPGKMAPP